MSPKLKQQFLSMAHRVGESGWMPGSSGNISARIPGTSEVYIKVTGASLRDLQDRDIVRVNMEGKVTEGNGRPTSEVGFHLGIYRIRPDVGAVIHDHSPFVTAFAIGGRSLPLITVPGKTILGMVPLVELAAAGSSELAQRVIKTFEDPEITAALLEGHGAVAIGADLAEAFRIAEWLEDAAREAFLVLLLGGFAP